MLRWRRGWRGRDSVAEGGAGRERRAVALAVLKRAALTIPRMLEEAIARHGGEGIASRAARQDASVADQAALLRFLESH